jgi:peptidoglycan/LPS O-acetylase OafA/YrhL
VVVLICAACLLAAPWGRARGLGFWLGDLLTHAAMAHNLTADWAAGLGNGSLWSLGMEVQLYLLYLGFLALYARVGLRGAVAVVVLVAGPVWTVWLHVSPTVIVCGPVRLGSWGSWPFPCWLPWTLGALAAEVEQGRLAWPAAGRRFRTALGLALAAAVFHPDLWPVLTGQRSLGANFAHWLPGGLADRLSGWTWALAGMTLILACGELERRGQSPNHGAARVLAAVGGRSYALYLTHMPVLGVCIKVLGLTDPWGCALVGVPLALAVAWLFFRFVEQPFLEARRKAAAPEEARPAPLAEPEAVLLPFPAGQAAPETVRGRLAA